MCNGYENGTKVHSVTFNTKNLLNCVNSLIGDGGVHGAKISPYPPFAVVNSSNTMTLSNGKLTIVAESGVVLYDSPSANAEIIEITVFLVKNHHINRLNQRYYYCMIVRKFCLLQVYK